MIDLVSLNFFVFLVEIVCHGRFNDKIRLISMKRSPPHNIYWHEICTQTAIATTTNQLITHAIPIDTNVKAIHFKKFPKLELVIGAITWNTQNNPGHAMIYYAPLKDCRGEQDDFVFVSHFMF